MKSKLLIIDPFNDNEVKLIENFENKQGSKLYITDNLKNIALNYTKEEYETYSNKSNVVIKTIGLLENEIKDYALIKGEKDTKLVTVELVTKTENYRTRPLVHLILDYSMNTLGMNSVVFLQKKEDKSLGKLLEKMEFENLGEELGVISYLKDKQIERELPIWIT